MKKIIFAILFLFFAAGLVGGVWTAWQRKIPMSFWDSFIEMPTGEKMKIAIETNQSVPEIAKHFVEEGIVQGSAGEFSRWLAKFGIDRRLRPGVYEIVPASAWDVARQMRTAEPKVESAMMIPGTNVYSFGDIFLISDDIATDALLENSLYPQEMVALLPPTKEGRLAFLLPETYSMPEVTPEELVRTASAAWWKEFGGVVPTDTDELKRLAIIASLIEREALWDEERPKIAGVIYNRLSKNMRLEIDAAVVYAHLVANGRKVTRVLFKDLEIDSPYNLYRVFGLTPDPICSPSLLSWRATLEPETHDLLYYVADKTGKHVFGKSYNEHLQNIKKVRQ